MAPFYLKKKFPIWLRPMGSTFEVISIGQKWITGLKKKNAGSPLAAYTGSYSVCLVLWSHIHCSSFLLLSQSVIPVFPPSLRAQARHYTPGWQLLAVSINVICYTWQEIWDGDMMIITCLFSGVRGINFDRLWNCISQARRVVFFPPFPLKPILMMFPTCQPDDGWIAHCHIYNT